MPGECLARVLAQGMLSGGCRREVRGLNTKCTLPSNEMVRLISFLHLIARYEPLVLPRKDDDTLSKQLVEVAEV